MPLHLSHRPKTLKEIVGNEATVTALQSTLSRKDDLVHSYIFTGPKGCGKTTLARITANILEISDLDFIEMNSASYRGIDSARDVIEKAQHRGMGKNGRRAWLFDESHKITKDAQEAMLKIVEEPPSHVFLFFATTDPQKMVPALRDRCHEYRVEALSNLNMAKLLNDTLKLEDATLDRNVINHIIAAAKGSARSALVILDKIIDLNDADMLTVIDNIDVEENEAIELCRALIQGTKWDKVCEILKGLADADVENVRQSVLGYCTNILLSKDAARAYVIMSCFKDTFYNTGKAGLVMATYEAVMSYTK